jgi:hypothetical protein
MRALSAAIWVSARRDLRLPHDIEVESPPRWCDDGALAAFARSLVAATIAFSFFAVSGRFVSAASQAAPVASSAEVVRTSVPDHLYQAEIARFTKAG